MSFGKPGWKVKNIKDYTLVSSSNRKNAVVIGRILYVIDDLLIYKGYFTIRPILKKGKLTIKDHLHEIDQNYFLREDEDFNDYKSSFDKLITQKINEKQLFFKLTDTLVKYNYENNTKG